MKVKFTMDQVVESAWQVVAGTSRCCNILEALPDAFFELLAREYNQNTGDMRYCSESVETMSRYLADIYEAKGFETTFWDRMSGSGQDHCPACGWWEWTVNHVSPSTGEMVCDECYAEHKEECAEDGDE